MKKILSFSLITAVVVFLASCGSTKNIPYITDSDQFDPEQSQFLYDARIMPKDILTITVNTVNPEAALPFNLIVRNTLQGNTRNVGTTGGSLQTYLVDNYGCIEFPIVGTLAVGGLTKSACEKLILEKIKPYLNVNENPVVTVRMSNYKITVIGEVNHPGMFNVDNEKINIFEALAKAGDLTIYGIRERVKLIREDSTGKKEIHVLNLNNSDLINSPYYYLQQNDIVYVEPNKVKARTTNISSSTTIWFSVSSALVSLSTFIISLTK